MIMTNDLQFFQQHWNRFYQLNQRRCGDCILLPYCTPSPNTSLDDLHHNWIDTDALGWLRGLWPYWHDLKLTTTFITIIIHLLRPVRSINVPVSDSFNLPLAKSQIFITRSAAPVANHSLPGSTAAHRTHPKWPEMTRYNFHGACHFGFGMVGAFFGINWRFDVMLDVCEGFEATGTRLFCGSYGWTAVWGSSIWTASTSVDDSICCFCRVAFAFFTRSNTSP